ncbi:GTP 3',8-cyclase MoaA [bacterium]
MIDSFGREINYLRISVTDLCNLRCRYCIPLSGAPKLKHENILTLEEFYLISEMFVSLGINKIRITGGEPLLKKGIERLGKLHGLKTLALTTNGILLKEYAAELKDKGVERLNISIDTLDEQKYFYLTRGGNLGDVLDGIEQAKKVGFDSIKLNIVLIKGINEDEIEQFTDLTRKENIDVRFIELMPIGKLSGWALERFIPNTMVLDKVKLLEKIEIQNPNSPAVYYKLKDAKRRVGLISSMTGRFCKACNRIRLSAHGRLKSCLHSNDEMDIKTPLRQGLDNLDLTDRIKEFIYKKPESHNLDTKEYIDKSMVQIGG